VAARERGAAQERLVGSDEVDGVPVAVAVATGEAAGAGDGVAVAVCDGG